MHKIYSFIFANLNGYNVCSLSLCFNSDANKLLGLYTIQGFIFHFLVLAERGWRFCSMCRLWFSITRCVKVPCDGDTIMYHLVEKWCSGKRPKKVQETIEGVWDVQLLGWKQQYFILCWKYADLLHYVLFCFFLLCWKMQSCCSRKHRFLQVFQFVDMFLNVFLWFVLTLV